MSRRVRPLAERFWAKVAVTGPDDCWLWQGATVSGYGYIGRGRRGDGNVCAHVLAIELTVGPVPAGLQVDHLCRVRACCNPAHLEVVTQQENIRREAAALLAARTTCRRGHPRTSRTARISRDRDGRFRQYRCLVCASLRAA